MTASPSEILAAGLFALALAHIFGAPYLARLGHRFPRHAGLLHLLGEVEVVFAFWALVLVAAMAAVAGGPQALAYAESRNFTEPLFVFVVMVIAASRPVLETAMRGVQWATRALPLHRPLAEVWLALSVVPLLGSLVTEPAAMTIAALLLAPRLQAGQMPERIKYLVVGALFVNVSIGGTLTSYAAPPVLMVAGTWQWDSAFMFTQFGWKAAVAVVLNASLATFMLRRHLGSEAGAEAGADGGPAPAGVPWPIACVNLALLALVVAFAHHPVVFLAVFLVFLGLAHAYHRHQDALLLKEALLVASFLAGLVVLGGLQRWWLQPVVASLPPVALFFGALGLTSIADNAALTYLGAQIPGLSDASKYMLVAGAVAGGGLTVIANAPNPAGAALLKQAFQGGALGMAGLLVGAAVPTAVAAALLLLL